MADRAGFEAFYRERLPGLVRACWLATLDRSIAEDIAAEAFARLWANWGRIRDHDHAGGYVYKTAMRLCARTVRRARRERRVDAAPAVDEIEGMLERSRVFATLAELPLRQRQAVVLRDWAGYEVSEIASILGTRDSTVRVHLARGRQALRRGLRMEDVT
jgi:RNA polymerase sigma-70 factor (ECF subfamily)